ncbi:hypothetical protein F4803DRAFT_308770 [Xylaria telfairii]|nr:hypothetical protein F4803DRAFT_308770 [Xylaria telfairii]
MTEMTAFNVTNINSLNILLSKSNDSGSVSNHPWDFWDSMCPNIRKLNITFRLPLDFYKELEQEEMIEVEFMFEPKEIDNIAPRPYTKWAYIWPAIWQLHQLRSLCIWSDHDSVSSWSVIKERLSFSSYSCYLCIVNADSLSRGKLTSNGVTRTKPGAHTRQPSGQTCSLPARHTASEAVLIGPRDWQSLAETRITDLDRSSQRRGRPEAKGTGPSSFCPAVLDFLLCGSMLSDQILIICILSDPKIKRLPEIYIIQIFNLF